MTTALRGFLQGLIEEMTHIRPGGHHSSMPKHMETEGRHQLSNAAAPVRGRGQVDASGGQEGADGCGFEGSG